MNIEDKKTKNSEIHDYKEEQFRSFCYEANKNLQNGNLNGAYKNFELAQNMYGCAYCLFLDNQISKSIRMLEKIEGASSAVNWLLCLIYLTLGKKIYQPTYFQIRNFYEPDMNMLLLYKNFDCFQKIYLQINYLANYNREIYKYTARVFIDNCLYTSAEAFLKKSIEIYYKDPEVHFMLGEIYLQNGNIKKAKIEYQKASEVSEGYFPAEKKLKELSEY